MQTQLFKNIPEFNKLVDPALFEDAINAARELVEINGRLLERYLENQIGLANLCVEGSEKQLQTVGSVSNPQDFSEKQTALYEEYRVKFTQATDNNLRLAQDAGEEYVAWFKRNLPKAEAVKVKSAKSGKVTAKAAA